MLRGIGLHSGFLLVAGGLKAQTPAPDLSALGREFYPTAAVQRKGWLQLKGWTLRLEQQQVPRNGTELLAALRMQDSVILEGQRQYAYFSLRSSRDVRDAEAGNWLDSLSSVSSRANAAVSSLVSSIADSSLQRWLNRVPALAAYRFALLDIRRARPQVAPGQARLLRELEPTISTWPSALYQQLIERTEFGAVIRGGDTLDVWRQRSAIAASPDRSVRREGFEKLYAGFTRQRDLYAFALVHTVQGRDQLARLQGDSSAPAQVYRTRYLQPSRVSALLARLRDKAQFYREYTRTKAQLRRKAGGSTHLEPWDLGATATDQPRFSLDSCRSLMRLALGPLGPAYAAELDSLLDPEADRLDVQGSAHRALGGSSIGFPHTPTGVYLSQFEGYYTDLSRLVHESAHAVHSRMMARGGVRPAQASGPSYLAEAVALMNELLVADYLARHGSGAQDRRFYMEKFLDKAFELIRGAQDADLEQTVYDSVTAGGVRTADDLDRLSSRVMGAYSIWDPANPQRREQWIYARLMYQDPLYLVNYMYSGVIALSLFRQYQREPASFARRYVAFLEGGYDAPPGDLLRRKLHVDLDDQKLIASDFDLLTARIGELNRLEAGSAR